MTVLNEVASARRGLMTRIDLCDSRVMSANTIAGVVVARSGESGAAAVSSSALVGQALGVTAYTSVNAPATTGEECPAGRQAEIVRRGQGYLNGEEAMALTDSVFVRFASGAGGTVLGSVRNDADSTTAVANANIRVERASTGPGPVLCSWTLS